MDQLILDVRLPDQAEFSNFVRGRNSETLNAVISHARDRADPVFWLHGAAAVGKSHLLLAACRHVIDSGGEAAFLAASRTPDLSSDAIAEWGGKNLIAIDDVDRLAGSARWEAALFQLFNTMRDNGNVMLASAASSPRATNFALRDLASRMSSGPVYKLKSLTDEERLEALRVRSSERGFELPDETGRYLMSRYPRDLSSLFAVLDKLDNASLRAQRRVTVPFVKQVLERSSENLDN
ncbi:MAG: DnaA regulatory inactivator Hda [Gammaproteobacteria bacterium]|nr:DnaA regulatory inactivator Hda [Gammaproteobacteria bacterium]MDH3767526.1 DnaA regulatory inactivator Hda [Gammaproteobacteria bacterium]